MRIRNIVVVSLVLAALLAASPAFARSAAQATEDKDLTKKGAEAPPEGGIQKQQDRDRSIGLPSSPLEVPRRGPRSTIHEKRDGLEYIRPVIDSYQFEPGYVGGVLYATDPGVVAPGGKLTVKVKGVKDPSLWFLRIASPELPSSYIQLSDARWIGMDTVVATIPSDVVKPLFRVPLDILVIRANGEHSFPYGALFEVPSETRFIDEADVEVERCGRSDGDSCNGQERAGDCGGVESSPAFYGVGDNAGIHATHKACWSFGSNTFRGKDRYEIRLANGWVFTKLDGSDWSGTSAKETVEGPTPNLPVGGTLWEPEFEWFVTDNDHLSYWMRVEIKGPKGKPHR